MYKQPPACQPKAHTWALLVTPLGGKYLMIYRLLVQVGTAWVIIEAGNLDSDALAKLLSYRASGPTPGVPDADRYPFEISLPQARRKPLRS